MSESEARLAFRRFPVLATADHSALLLAAPAFVNYCLMLIAARARGTNLFFTHSTCRASLVTWSGYGPGYVQDDGGPWPVFRQSRKRMKRLCGHSPVPGLRFALEQLPVEIRRLLPDGPFDRPCQAFARANAAFTRAWTRAGDAGGVMLSHLPSAVIARHLEDRSSPLRRLVCDPEVQASFYTAYRELRGDKLSTTLFWTVRDGRLDPLTVHSGRLIARRDAAAYSYPLDPAVLADQLRRGELLPDLPLTFLALSVLPGLRTLGGPAQLGYLPAIETAWRRTSVGAAAGTPDGRGNCGWLFGVIDPFFQVPARCARDVAAFPLSDWADRWSDTTLADAVGDLDRTLLKSGVTT